MKNQILINENAETTRSEIEAIEMICFPTVERIIEKYAEFNLGNFTTELLTDAISNNSTLIEQLFTKQAEVDTANIRNPILKANMKNGIKQAIIDFRLEVNSLVSLSDRLLLKYVTIEENRPILSNENLEKLKESNRTYVSPEQAKFFELHKKCADDLNQLFVNAKSKMTLHDIVNIFDLVDSEIVPKNISSYSYFLD